jgi:hypothetical protein
MIRSCALVGVLAACTHAVAPAGPGPGPSPTPTPTPSAAEDAATPSPPPRPAALPAAGEPGCQGIASDGAQAYYVLDSVDLSSWTRAAVGVGAYGGEGTPGVTVPTVPLAECLPDENGGPSGCEPDLAAQVVAHLPAAAKARTDAGLGPCRLAEQRGGVLRASLLGKPVEISVRRDEVLVGPPGAAPRTVARLDGGEGRAALVDVAYSDSGATLYLRLRREAIDEDGGPAFQLGEYIVPVTAEEAGVRSCSCAPPGPFPTLADRRVPEAKIDWNDLSSIGTPCAGMTRDGLSALLLMRHVESVGDNDRSTLDAIWAGGVPAAAPVTLFRQTCTYSEDGERCRDDRAGMSHRPRASLVDCPLLGELIPGDPVVTPALGTKVTLLVAAGRLFAGVAGGPLRWVSTLRHGEGDVVETATAYQLAGAPVVFVVLDPGDAAQARYEIIGPAQMGLCACK